MQDACAYSLKMLILSSWKLWLFDWTACCIKCTPCHLFQVALSSNVGAWFKLAYTSLWNKNNKNISLKSPWSTLMGLISQMGQTWQDFHVLLKDEPKGWCEIWPPVNWQKNEFQNFSFILLAPVLNFCHDICTLIETLFYSRKKNFMWDVNHYWW